MTTASTTLTFDSFIVQPGRNGAAALRVRHAVRACAQGRPAGPLLLLGTPASGKSHLLAAAHGALAPGLGRLLISYGGADFVACCQAAHYTGDVAAVRRLVERGEDLPALRRRWAFARAILIDDLDLLAAHAAAAYELCRLLDAARSTGALLLLAARRTPEMDPAWPRTAIQVLARCPRVRLAPVEPGPAGVRRQTCVALALAAHGLTLSPTTLAAVARLPLSPDELAGLVADLWDQPERDETQRLHRLYARYATLREAHLRAAQPDPAAIMAAAAEAYGVTLAAMHGPSRRAPVALARQVAMYLLVTDAGLGPTAAGALLGRDHSTVLHGRGRVAALLASDPSLARRLAAIRAQTRSGREISSPTAVTPGRRHA